VHNVKWRKQWKKSMHKEQGWYSWACKAKLTSTSHSIKKYVKNCNVKSLIALKCLFIFHSFIFVLFRLFNNAVCQNIGYTRVCPKVSGLLITKYKLTTINTWEATQRVMAAKLTRLTHKIAIQLHLVAESCTICSSCSKQPVWKLLDTPSYSAKWWEDVYRWWVGTDMEYILRSNPYTWLSTWKIIRTMVFQLR
jgi:hypothetical protein